MTNFNAHMAVSIGAASMFLGAANAHGHLVLPSVTFSNSFDKTQFIATIASSASGFSGSFSGSPADNTAAFWTAFKSSKFSTIKEFVTQLGQIVANEANIECGHTDPTENPQPLPNELEWAHSDTEGFTSSHNGPCEAWCDDTRVFQDTDCAAHFTTAPAKMPYDKAGCSGASHLKFYWLALHTPTWQIYANCAALEGGSGSHLPSQSNSTSRESTEQSKTPTVKTSTPVVATFTPTTTAATPTVATFMPTVTATPISVARSRDEDSIDIAGSDEDGEDCESFDVAIGENNEVSRDVDSIDNDCGSFDVADNEEDRHVAGNEVDKPCDSLDINEGNADGNAADKSVTISEPSLNFDIVDSSYIIGKVQVPYQN